MRVAWLLLSTLGLTRSFTTRTALTDLSRFGSKWNSVFLYKADPEEYSILELEKAPQGTDVWDGVRNHVAKNNMKAGKINDLVLFYHSNSKKQTGIVGVCKIVREAYEDPVQSDPTSKYFHAKGPNKKTGEWPWKSVDIQLLEKWPQPVTLNQLKERSETDPTIKAMQLFTTARLSVQVVEKEAFEKIEAMRLENQSAAEDEEDHDDTPVKKKARKG